MVQTINFQISPKFKTEHDQLFCIHFRDLLGIYGFDSHISPSSVRISIFPQL